MVAEYITAPSFTHPTIHHGFFTRNGGVSEGEYASLNTGYGSGDDKNKVRENRKRIAQTFGSSHHDIVTCYQIHSNTVHTIDSMSDAKLEGDALVTNVPGLVIAVLTADCVPVLFADPITHIIGAAHAGWKGAHAGIISNTMDAMERLGAKREQIYTAIGPSIAQKSYEVGVDVKEQFIQKNSDFSAFFAAGVDKEHFQFDLPGLVEQQIIRLGIANYKKLDYDTYTDEERFFSYRRSTHRKQSVYGRQCSAIMLI